MRNASLPSRTILNRSSRQRWREIAPVARWGPVNQTRSNEQQAGSQRSGKWHRIALSISGRSKSGAERRSSRAFYQPSRSAAERVSSGGEGAEEARRRNTLDEGRFSVNAASVRHDKLLLLLSGAALSAPAENDTTILLPVVVLRLRIEKE